MSCFRRDPARRDGWMSERKRMKFLRLLNLTVIVAFLTACKEVPPILGGEPTPTLPSAQATIRSAPDASAAINKYLGALQKDDFETMYGMLSQASQAAITFDDYSARWIDSLNNMSASTIEYTVNSSQIHPDVAEIGYSIIYKTALVGDIQRNILVRMTNENNEWKVIWDESQILPELAGGNLLRMEYSVPARGDIYDRDGLPIVAQSDSFAFGIQTDQIDLEMQGALTKEFGKLCGFDPEYIQDQIDAS